MRNGWGRVGRNMYFHLPTAFTAAFNPFDSANCGDAEGNVPIVSITAGKTTISEPDAGQAFVPIQVANFMPYK